MLKGQELIDFVKSHPELSKSQLARKAGYTSESKDGKVKVQVQAFYANLVEAQGLYIKGTEPGHTVRREAGYQTTVHKSGILLVGKSYTIEFGAEPGDVFGIEVREDGIWLPLKERDLEARKLTAPAVTTVSETEKVAVAA